MTWPYKNQNLEMFLLEENSFPDLQSALALSSSSPLRNMDEEGKKEYWGVLALRHCPGLGIRSQIKLLRHFGSAYAALQNAGDWPRLGIKRQCVEEIKKGSWRESAKVEWEEALRADATILLWTNHQFPPLLRELSDCPILLYCAGDMNLLKCPCVGMVGSRDAIPRNREIAFLLARSLSACGITVVSGMANGIDGNAHCGAMEEVGRSIGVLGTGINIDYPSINQGLFDKMRKEGLLLSEFAPYTPPAAHNFPVRNRIISGLSFGVIVVEAAARSGSLITARLALEQNRQVFAVPGAALDATSLGCQNLIRQGARAVFHVDDILSDLADELRAYGISIPTGYNEEPKKENVSPARKPDSFSPPQSGIEHQANASGMGKIDNEVATQMSEDETSEQILRVIRNRGRIHVDELAKNVNLSPSDLNTRLVFMEMRGQIRRLDGANYEAS